MEKRREFFARGAGLVGLWRVAALSVVRETRFEGHNSTFWPCRALQYRSCYRAALLRQRSSSCVRLTTNANGHRAGGYHLTGVEPLQGLLPHEMRVFLASLRAVGSAAEVVIFSAERGGRADLAEVTATFGARMIEYDFEDL